MRPSAASSVVEHAQVAALDAGTVHLVAKGVGGGCHLLNANLGRHPSLPIRGTPFCWWLAFLVNANLLTPCHHRFGQLYGRRH